MENSMKPLANPFAGKSYSAGDIIPLAAIFGIICLSLIGVNVKIGLVMLGLAIGALVGIVKSTGPKQSTPLQLIQHETPIKTIFSEYDLTERPATAPAVPQGAAIKQVDLKLAQPLLTTLRITGHNLDAPVVFLGEGNAAITTQDVIIEIARIMREKQDDFGQMVKVIPDMYNLLWDYAGEATQKYSDLNLIRVHIASSVYFKVKAEKPALQNKAAL
jgi:hypothetical protein